MFKKLLIALGVMLLWAASAFSQTTVNLTVTDTPDNQLWTNGTWAVKLQQAAGNSSQTNTFTLLTGGGSLAAQSGTLSASATASISLPPNANIGPGGTTWQFTVCPQASAACFQQSVTVTVATPQTLNLTPPSIRINLATATPPVSAYSTGEINGATLGSQFMLIGTGQQFCTAVTGNTCTTWAAGGGITSVTVLPATCTPGTTAPVQLTVAPFDIYYCIATNTWARAGTSSNGSTILATNPKYNLPATGYYSCVANYSNVSTTLTIDTTVDQPFTAAMVGWQIFLTNGPCQGSNGGGAGQVSHFNGTIAAFTDSSHVVLSGTPSGSCAGKQTAPILSCRAYWVPADSAVALNSAWADATAARGCPTLVLPGGVYKFNTAIKSTNTCGAITALATGTALNGPSAKGISMNGTILVADPSFDAATCNPGCVFQTGGLQSEYLSDFTVSGGGNSVVANGNGKCKISSPSWPSTIQDVFLDSWGHNTPGFTGLCWGGTNQGQAFIKNVNIYNGGYNCASIGIVSVFNLFCFTPAGSTINTAAGTATGGTNIYGSQFNGGAAGGFTLAINGAAACASPNVPIVTIDGTTINGSTNNGALIDQSACTVVIEKSTLASTAGTNLSIGNSGNGVVARVIARDSVIASSATNLGGSVAGSSFVDGGNTLSGANTLTTLTIVADGHSLKAACTGVATASQTLGLYGTGPNETLTTCTSTTIGSGVPMQGARTALNLIVTATAGGVNASSGVVTVLKNGVATTITCTLGTTTACQDGTHNVSFADGDLISIQFTTQAAETLAGVKAFVEWN